MVFLAICANTMSELETSQVGKGHLFIFGSSLAWCCTSCHSGNQQSYGLFVVPRSNAASRRPWDSSFQAQHRCTWAWALLSVRDVLGAFRSSRAQLCPEFCIQSSRLSRWLFYDAAVDLDSPYEKRMHQTFRSIFDNDNLWVSDALVCVLCQIC